MSDLLKKAVSLGLGLTIVSKEKVEKIVDDLVKRGELAPAESKELINRLVERGEEEQIRLKELVSEQVKRALQDLGSASSQELESLHKRVAELELKVAELERSKS
ncbi:polyhydroxyalkanoate synthesis regulator [Paenibacillus sp. CAA11]|uniref:phasin family protein n=1 Tax=Paenibacillus sp. CAA11 TaxID=1532905 RepID=UPI000D37A0F9|nr:polyhydroxyalkanoate synthesis regulator [Paenibacillus sp. CAA11]AWB46324.1 polyhydroxyalkanoate synthesis regulator [Paenibacillus sp. CAA11]